ncbi:TPA: type II toxin-antitoxin system prevent-host-death family antitoxin [Aeromonas hydrophila]|nr:type II toxin-antitoxin system prevent-host-death family antitoxin [Aeromonas hydrophila]
MAALVERADQVISATEMSRNFSSNISRIASGQQDRLVVMKAGKPLAVVISLDELYRLQSGERARDVG